MSTQRSTGARNATSAAGGALKSKPKGKAAVQPKAKSKAKAKTKATANAKPKPKVKTPARVQAKVPLGKKTKTKKTSQSARLSGERQGPALLQLVRKALEDMKAVDIRVLDVRGISDVTDYMVIAGGTSDRHLRSVADRVVQMCKAAGQRPLGVEGEQQGEWVLVDLPDVMVHIMLPRTRELYQLEQLWDADSIAGRG
jgi:ribosome-associated protein